MLNTHLFLAALVFDANVFGLTIPIELHKQLSVQTILT
jgi:hypothetical protein